MSSLLLFVLVVLSLSNIESCTGRSIKGLTMPPHNVNKDISMADVLNHGTHSLKALEKRSRIGGTTIPSSNGVPMKREAILSSGAVQILSHVEVSKRQARKNCSKYPGFHLDYVGPRTHPPAHN
ncbi:uncharacterized protein A4U43_C04F35300 [Asparagus officinalis]|uniref:Neprosin activation peptide domain-containing protein n=1 Tax=Asparagus officinalis TaxID=4686 RepID=A0A5P1FAW8_ASPOF|nr:uncharacterized protein A4U43_C04F35300 [Asparagus officinalis]